MEKFARERYKEFVKNHPCGTFFQSRAFGEFQEKIPYRAKSWALFVPRRHSGAGGNDTMATCLVIKIKLRFGKCWLWVPYGPLIEADRSEEKRIEACSGIFEDLARIAKEERAVFARIEPASVIASAAKQSGDPSPLARDDRARSSLAPDCFVGLRPPRNDKIVHSPERYTPEYSLILDLEKSEEEILAQMKPKGRYNISTALRHGVHVEQFVHVHTKVQSSLSTVKIRASADFDAFYEILQKTASRDGFGIHPKFFYETLLETFGAEGAKLFLAYKNSGTGGNDKKENREVIGGIIVIFYKDTATYYYGASSYEHRNLMAPYLLQWEAIREAKRRGMKKYDFLGIAPPDVTLRQAQGNKHAYAGITEFKKKFGGTEITYPPAFDVVYRPLLYRAMRLARSCRQ